MFSIPSRKELSASPLFTQRTCLSPIDVGDSAELWQIVESSRAWLQAWLPWVPFQQDADASRRFAEASMMDWDAGRALRFAIRARQDRRLLGVVGLEACVEMHRACDLGYWLRHEAAGNGYMAEAAQACVEFAVRRVGAHRVRIAAATDNHASLAVIARLGFHFEGVARQAEWCDGRWLDHAVFSMIDCEWPPVE